MSRHDRLIGICSYAAAILACPPTKLPWIVLYLEWETGLELAYRQAVLRDSGRGGPEA